MRERLHCSFFLVGGAGGLSNVAAAMGKTPQVFGNNDTRVEDATMTVTHQTTSGHHGFMD